MALVIDQEQAVRYHESSVQDEYDIVSGAYALPLAVTPSATQVPVVVVQAHAPYRTRQVTFKAVKDMTPPVIPKPVDAGAYTFLSGGVCIPGPSPNMQGTFSWEVKGVYHYVSSVYNADGDGFVLTSLPYIYPFQTQNNQQSSSSSDQPEDVKVAGVGAKAGWAIGQTIQLTNPAYSYNEPTYLPGVFFSETLVNGPTEYPNL